MTIPKRIAFGICAFLWLAGGYGVLETFADEAGAAVKSVEVRGNREVSSVTVLAKVKTRPGLIFDQDVLNEDIKRLYASGFFSDVRVETEQDDEGVHVLFTVEEKSRLEEIVIEGNKALGTRQIRDQFKSVVGEPLDERGLKSGIKAVRSLYAEKGYQLATVEYEIDTDPDRNRSTVYVTIQEGGKLKIRKIFVTGNSVFSDKELLKAIQTRRDTLFTSGILDEDAFEVDLERIKYKYWQKGYADVEVTPSFHYDLGERKSHMYIVIAVDEGSQYLTGPVEVKGNVLFPSSDILSHTSMSQGAPFSRFHLRDDLNKIQAYYFERGYVNAGVAADTRLDETGQVVAVSYRITENNLAFVDQIRITGNDRTKDHVIRREMRLKPGDRFDGEKLKRSQQRLVNLGYFEEVTYDTEPGRAPDTNDLVINVKERKTGEFTFGAGFSTSQRFVGFVDVIQRNFDLTDWPHFVGGGQRVRLRAEAGSVFQDFEFNFTEPWMLGYPFSFGVDLFSRTYVREDYDEERLGGTLRLGKEFTEYDTARLNYTFQEIDVTDLSEDASADIRAEEGKAQVSALSLDLTHNTTDNRFVPSTGNVVSLEGGLFGSFLGGDKDFYKLQLDARKYFPFFTDHVLDLRFRLGIAEEFGASDRVPVYERFFAGGSSTVRGYNYRRLGPIDGGDPIGGNTLIIANAEYTIPLVEDLIKGAVFFDTGNVFRESYDFNITDLREGVGAGIRIKTPIGPVRIDYGFPLDLPEGEENDKGRFYFDIERGF
ncbi:MAG: outer membrane protein assembly factor BamA [Candidatus Omnitrophica bacterium]|nr:outer membrane protein assembly factor BamA [Candidatus Omnitrophota bacterium]